MPTSAGFRSGCSLLALPETVAEAGCTSRQGAWGAADRKGEALREPRLRELNPAAEKKSMRKGEYGEPGGGKT